MIGTAMATQGPLLSLEHAALVVVDMQHGFLHPEGAWSRALGPIMSPKDTELVVYNNRRAIAAMRRAGRPVIFVRVEHRADQTDQALSPQGVKSGLLSLRLCIEGTPGAALMDGLQGSPNDYIVTKKGHGSFQFTHLDRL